MPAFNTISVEKLARLVGIPAGPVIVDLRPGGAGLIPGSIRRPADDVEGWAGAISGSEAVLVCDCGETSSAATAAWLRHRGVKAEILEGGFAAWTAAGLPVIDESVLPARDGDGLTRWVTRARPKVDRIACPWLIRRFVDPSAVFLFAAPAEVAGVAERLGAAPFDIEGVQWSHRGELCTFDVMVDLFGLASLAPLARLATIVRGADTARPDIAPQAAGLLAVSLGLSRMYSADHDQLEAGMIVYDALYRWCRDAIDETHDWVSHSPRARVRS